MFRNFTSGSVVKNPPANTGEIREMGWIPGWEDPLEEGHGHPLLYSCLEKPHQQRSLVGHGAWGLKESDTTETT